MKFTQKHADFSVYAFEDFLQDEFFIRSIHSPNEETALFWQDFEKSNPANIDEFCLAKEYLETVKAGDGILLGDNEVADLWNRIDKTNHKRVRTRNYRIVKWSAAASVAAILGIFFFMNFHGNTKRDIASYAVHTKDSVSDIDGDVLLVLSEDNIIRIEDKEASVMYGEHEIRAGKETVSKEVDDNYNQLIVPHGKRSVLTLADGSRIWVNSGTRVVYPSRFDKKQREVYVDGEAYLEVSKDPDRPFFVKTKDMNVRVLGTKFNVTAYESETFSQVVLAEGKVQVQSGANDAVILKPDEKYAVKEGVDAVKKVDAGKYISWVQGFYNFESAGFGFVINRLSMYYGIDIEVDPTLEKVKCSGKIDLNNPLETVLDGLDFIIPLSYRYETSNATYYINAR
ncbi:FecR family protein [Proteiniphilum sp. UBA5384]|uniref:FecR family protein n=1 Tax=Proteiniphilum sp. UBA5384 TaxID=1947279 RepID=UPI0025E94875|nr:FecR domain-containing protein [Proteiniphilum sp. UBA5384]